MSIEPKSLENNDNQESAEEVPADAGNRTIAKSGWHPPKAPSAGDWFRVVEKEKRRTTKWTPPPRRPSEVSPQSDGASGWTIPPLSPSDDAADSRAFDGASKATKLRRWHLFPLGLFVLLALNAQKLPGIWAETFCRKPSEKWVRAIAGDLLSLDFPDGKYLNFETKNVDVLREAPAAALIKLKGETTTREVFYRSVAVDDPLLGLEAKLPELRRAEERARFIQNTAHVEIKPIEPLDTLFVKETMPAGRKLPFEFHFKASRQGWQWQKEKVIVAHLTSPTGIEGKPIGRFSKNAAITGTDDGNRRLAEFSKRIDAYTAAVAEAERTAAKRLVAEGRDASGNLLFPKDKPLPGERFPETRMRFLDSGDVEPWPEDKLQYAINEIFARHGAEFGNKKLREWFGQFGWYKPSPGLSFDQVESWLSDIEKHNVKTLGYARVSAREKAIATQQAATQRTRQEAATQRAHQEAMRKAQQDAMVEQLVGGILQGITNGLRNR